MAKGAAKEKQLGALHAKVADVFIKVLARYEQRLDVIDSIDQETLEDDFLKELLADGALPNPAMLSAITKFLKDNDINFDNEQIEALSDQERRLAERKKLRSNIVSLTSLSAQQDGTNG